jgi:hypothetical protein
MAYIINLGDGQTSYTSQWALLARDPSMLDNPAIASRVTGMDNFNKNLPLWTDDYSNLFQILR